jgi:hypothetical protein
MVTKQKQTRKNKHTMKNYLILALLAVSLAANAQKSNAVQAIYDRLEEEENVMTLSFSKKMIEDIDTDIEWGDQIKYLKGDLHKVKLMLIEDGENATKLVKYVYKQLDKLGYKRTEIKDDDEPNDDDRLWVFTNRKGKDFTEAHFLIEDEDGSGIFMSVFGEFTLTDEKN